MPGHRSIFELAWPYTLSIATGFIIQAVDSTMAAPLGTAALAALSVAGTTIFLPSSFCMGLITTVQKRTSQSGGTKDSAWHAIASGLILGVFFSIPFTLIFMALAPGIVSLFTSGLAAQLATRYLRIYSLALVFISANFVVSGYWLAALKSKTRLWVTSVVATVTVIGNLLLAPRWGLSGIAIASVCGISSGFFVNLALLIFKEKFRWRTPEWRVLVADAKAVVGISCHQISLAMTLNVAVFLVGLIGINALAIANVIGVLSLPALYLGIGYGTATGTFLAKLIAADDFSGARAVSRKALLQVSIVSVGLATLLLVFSGPIRMWFFKDQMTFVLSKWPFFMLGLLCLIDGLCCTLQRFHFISDGIKKSFVIMTVVQWGFFIPVAWAGIHFFHIGYSLYMAIHVIQRAVVMGALYFYWLKRVPAQEDTHRKVPWARNPSPTPYL